MRTQAPQTAAFATAFAYVEDVLRAGSEARARLAGIAVGESKKIDLDGGVFAIEQVYETKARADGVYESHRKYIDVQVIVAGEEAMEVQDVSRLTVRQAYDAERDFMLYHDHSGGSSLRVQAGDAAIFYPADGHMPTLRSGAAPVVVRKTVVKVPVA